MRVRASGMAFAGAVLMMLLLSAAGRAPGVALEATPSSTDPGAAQPPSHGEPDAPTSRLDPDTLEARIHRLRRAGAYDEACTAAHALQRMLGTAAGAPLWRRQSADWLVRTLDRVVAWDDSARAALAAADRATLQIDAHFERSQYAAALDLALRRLDIQTRLLGSEHPEVARSLNALARLFHAQGDYAAADSLCREALALRRRLFGGSHPDIAHALNMRGVLFWQQGRYDEAEAPWREAYLIRRDLLGEDDRLTAASLNNLAVLYSTLGRHQQAEPFHRRSLALAIEHYGGESEPVARGLFNLGLLYHHQGDLARAEELLREALELLTRLYGDEHPQVAGCMSTLAEVLQENHDPEDAEAFARRALKLQREVLGPDHPEVAGGLRTLASILVDRGSYSEAQPLLHEALAIRAHALGADHVDVAQVREDLADLHLRTGHVDLAEPELRGALTVCRRYLGEEHPRIARCLEALALCRHARGDDAEAESLLVSAARIFERARLRVGAGLARARFQASPYRRLAALRAARGEGLAAWNAVERAHARALADMLLAAGKRELSDEALAREDSLRTLMADLERRLNALRSAGLSGAAADADSFFQETRRHLLLAESAWATVHEADAGRDEVLAGQTSGLTLVQRSLCARTALVGWLQATLAPGEPVCWAYAIRDTGAVIWVRLGADASNEDSLSLTQAPRLYRRALMTAGDCALPVRDLSPVAPLARRACELWLSPLLRHLEDVDRLIVVPSGPLLGCPLEALIDEGGAYLDERYTISYVPSATILVWLRQQKSRAQDPDVRRALLVGDPLLRDGRFTPLPATREEVAATSVFFPECTSLLGSEASEPRLSALAEGGALSRYDLLHFATHALVDDNRPERSCIVLAQAPDPDPLAAALAGERIYDGLLSVAEIAREWRLDCDLVTLSGCRTGLGREAHGEGHIGFVHAFLQAGARNLLVSLWRVEDRAAALLMKRFYENATGAGSLDDDRGGPRSGPPMTKASALREAKRWLRSHVAADGSRPYAHPAYWSVFVLMGDGF